MAWPAMIESIFVTLAGFIDSLMVSSLGANAVAAVGLTTQPKFIGLAIFFALSVSLSAIVARRRGTDDKKSANNVLVTGFLFAVIGALLSSLLFVKFADPIMKFCGSTENTHNDAVTYFSIIMGGMIFNCLQIAVNSAQRGAGNTKITMRTNITSNLVNIVLNYLLIGGKFGFPALGIQGAALATVLGTVVSCIMSIISISKKDSFLSIPYIIKNKIMPSISSFIMICKLGYSLLLEQILLRIGFAATAIMAAKMGDNSMAAHQVGMNILGISFSFGDGLQSAAVALIGRKLGEGDKDKAKAYGSACQFLGSIASIFVTIAFAFSGKAIMQLFFKESEIVSIGIGIIWLLIPIAFFQIRSTIYMGCLRGAGDTLYTAIISVICVTIIRTAFSYFFGFALGWGIFGVWTGIIAHQMAMYILSCIRFKSGKWTSIVI